MNIDQLNSRYGAPGRIVFRPGHCGYPNVVLANKYGTAEVALLGANVLSYRPTGHAEVIFRPSPKPPNLTPISRALATAPQNYICFAPFIRVSLSDACRL